MEPEFLRIVKNELKSSGVPYIRDRTRALDGQCVADAIGRHFSDGKGGTKRYNWSDFTYDLACGWIVLEVSTTDISQEGSRKACTPSVFMCAARAYIMQGPTENRDSTTNDTGAGSNHPHGSHCHEGSSLEQVPGRARERSCDRGAREGARCVAHN